MKIICQRIIGIILVVMLLACTNISLAVSQSDISAQQQEQESNKNKINEKQAQIDEVEEIKDATQKEVEQLNSQITEYQGQISTLDAQISNTNEKIKEEEQKLQQAEKDYQDKEELIKKRMVAIYMSGDTSYLDVLLSSKSLTDFISSYYLVSEVTQMDAELLEKIQKQKEEIENSKKELEESKTSLTTAKAEKESVNTQLKTAKSEKNAKVSQLSAQEQQLQSQIEELQKDNVAIDKKIQSMKTQIEAARKAAEEAKKNQNNNTSKNNSSNNSSSTSGKSSAGFIRPVNSYITTGMYYSSGSYHGAVDFGASGISGSPVFAVADGIVVTTQALTTSYGNYIILYHPSSNLYTLYAHGQAGSISVSAGQTVKQGQQIMRVGSTGNSTGPHLHFEVRTSPGYYSNRVNPSAYLP